MIRHTRAGWQLFTRDGSRVLGTHGSYAKALAQERAIEAHKHARRSNPRDVRRYRSIGVRDPLAYLKRYGSRVRSLVVDADEQGPWIEIEREGGDWIVGRPELVNETYAGLLEWLGESRALQGKLIRYGEHSEGAVGDRLFWDWLAEAQLADVVETLETGAWVVPRVVRQAIRVAGRAHLRVVALPRDGLVFVVGRRTTDAAPKGVGELLTHAGFERYKPAKGSRFAGWQNYRRGYLWAATDQFDDEPVRANPRRRRRSR